MIEARAEEAARDNVATLSMHENWAKHAPLMYDWLKTYNCQRSTITCRSVSSLKCAYVLVESAYALPMSRAARVLVQVSK